MNRDTFEVQSEQEGERLDKIARHAVETSSTAA